MRSANQMEDALMKAGVITPSKVRESRLIEKYKGIINQNSFKEKLVKKYSCSQSVYFGEIIMDSLNKMIASPISKKFFSHLIYSFFDQQKDQVFILKTNRRNFILKCCITGHKLIPISEVMKHESAVKSDLFKMDDFTMEIILNKFVEKSGPGVVAISSLNSNKLLAPYVYNTLVDWIRIECKLEEFKLISKEVLRFPF